MANKNLMTAAQQQTAKIFSFATTQAQEEKSISYSAEKKPIVKQVFSFRGQSDAVKAWRLYASISGMKVDELGSAALTEYIKNHPLSQTEQALFNEKLENL